MNYKKTVLFLGLVGSLILSGCASSGKNTQAPKEEKSPYVIGALTAQTGAASWLGDSELKAVNLLADQINAGGGINGHPIKVIPFDTTSNPELAVTGMEKILTEDAIAVIGPTVVGESKAVAPLVKDKGPLVYSLSGGYRPQNRWMFGTSCQTKVMQKAILEYFKSKGITKVALLANTDSTGQEAVDGLNQLIKEDPSIKLLITERVNPTDVDVSLQLNNIKSKQPQALITWMTGKLVGVVIKNFYQSGMDIPIVVSHGNASYAFLDSIKGFEPKVLLMPSTKDFAWKDIPEGDPQKKPNEKLHTDYKNKYGKEADYGAAMAYDAMSFVIKGLQEVGPDKEKLRTYIEQQKNLVGTQAIYNFSPEDHRGTALKDAIVIQISNGEFRKAK